MWDIKLELYDGCEEHRRWEIWRQNHPGQEFLQSHEILSAGKSLKFKPCRLQNKTINGNFVTSDSEPSTLQHKVMYREEHSTCTVTVMTHLGKHASQYTLFRNLYKASVMTVSWIEGMKDMKTSFISLDIQHRDKGWMNHAMKSSSMNKK